MNEKMKRDTLTADSIKRDLAAKLDYEQAGKCSPASTLIACAAYILMFGLLVGTLCLFGPTKLGIIILCAAAVGFSGFLTGALLILRKVKKEMALKRQWLERGEFRIVGDKLVRARMDDNFGNEKSLSEGSDLLVFARYGEYYIPHITHYAWSKDYYLSPDGMFNTSIVDDTFYLVLFTSDPKRKIMMIYNTKFFELDGDDPFDYEDFS